MQIIYLAKQNTNQNKGTTIHWFRKGLRLHDNPSLFEAVSQGQNFIPIFILDPWFLKPQNVGTNRMGFLLESLKDLSEQIKDKFNSKLIIAKGNPIDVIPKIFNNLQNITLFTFEKDTEPYANQRDDQIIKICLEHKIKCTQHVSHTLYDLDFLLDFNEYKVPQSYSSFLNLLQKVGKVKDPLMTPLNEFPPLPQLELPGVSFYDDVPSLEDIGYDSKQHFTFFKGGERESLKKMKEYLFDKQKTASFKKPDTNPTSIKPDTTALSPYLKFGCLSPRLFFSEINKILTQHKNHSLPPESLIGQLYWREFFYLNAYGTKDFHSMELNKNCRNIPWGTSETHFEHFESWKNAKTGFPAIDAVMTQLTQQGWIHHLARHLVACFLTRGDLWVSWEKGRDVFDQLLLDADYSLNNANWMYFFDFRWLSASCFYYQYFKCYSPISFFQKRDPQGKYIRHFLPQLKLIPDKYIYEPWKAPIEVQRASKCIIGKDYPSPIVNHIEVSKQNMEKMSIAYQKYK